MCGGFFFGGGKREREGERENSVYPVFDATVYDRGEGILRKLCGERERERVREDGGLDIELFCAAFLYGA